MRMHPELKDRSVWTNRFRVGKRVGFYCRYPFTDSNIQCFDICPADNAIRCKPISSLKKNHMIPKGSVKKSTVLCIRSEMGSAVVVKSHSRVLMLLFGMVLKFMNFGIVKENSGKLHQE
jgi:hypothetical protein